MKSDCSEYKRLLASSFLGELDEKGWNDLEQHLAACPLCRSEQAKYEKTLNMLKQANDDPVTRHFFVYPAENK